MIGKPFIYTCYGTEIDPQFGVNDCSAHTNEEEKITGELQIGMTHLGSNTVVLPGML